MSGLLSLWQISRSLCKGAGKSLAPGQKLRALFLNAQTRLRALTSRRWALGVAARRPHRAEACDLLGVLRLLRVLWLLLPVLATQVAEKWKRRGRASGRKPGGVSSATHTGGPFLGQETRPRTGSDRTGLPARPPGQAGLPSGSGDLETGGPRGHHVHSR